MEAREELEEAAAAEQEGQEEAVSLWKWFRSICSIFEDS
jgi:hypothetical protein